MPDIGGNLIQFYSSGAAAVPSAVASGLLLEDSQQVLETFHLAHAHKV
jgi:hypothetical protein